MRHQRRNRALSLAVLALGFSGAAPGFAAVTPGGDTTVAANSSLNTTVGDTGVGTLRIDGGSSLANWCGYLGYNAGSVGEATVSGAGSQWTNGYDLYVGRYGSGRLTVADGGLVTARTLFASPADLNGNGTITANGAVLDAELVLDKFHGTTQTLTFGSGGTLNLLINGTGTLGAGHKGSGSLRVSDGVVAASYDGRLGSFPGSIGTAIVSGAGSKWTNNSNLYVGYSGSGSLRIESGGQATSSGGYVGFNEGSSGTVTVSGADSKWINSGNLYVGDRSQGTLRIESGGQVSNSSGHVGRNSTWSCTATVTGAGSKWTNSGGLYVGSSAGSSLTIEAGGQVSSSGGYLGNATGTSGTATITGPGSTWANSGDLYMGGFGGTGSLTVADGGVVTAKTLYASLSDLHGNGTITANGAVLDADLVFDRTHGTTRTLVFGSGGALNLLVDGSARLGIGYRGAGSLRIADGVTVSSTSGNLGYNAGSTGTATVSGAGSKWINSGDLYVGSSGSGTLSIKAGGQVNSSSGHVTGTATVRGAGSRWTCSGQLSVGSVGIGTLIVDGGAQVSSSNGDLGTFADYTGTATVSGAGSKWTNSGDLYVGRFGTGSLTVADGGLVTAKTLYASLSDLYGNGTITANGAVLDADLVVDKSYSTTVAFGVGGTLNLTINGAGALGAGYRDRGSLRIGGGAWVGSASGALGSSVGSAGAATVSGAGSRWTNSGTLFVGSSGSGSLSIEAGAQVTDSSGYVGRGAGSDGTVTVSGAGSKWTNSTSLHVGSSGSGVLQIEAGGRVSSTFGYIGLNGGSSGAAKVKGAGSVWTHSGDFFVGYSGSGIFSIEAGGQVSNNNSISHLGFNSGSVGMATVTGAGSKWTSNGWLHVGVTGMGTLTAADGGKVAARSMSINNNQSSVHLHVSGDDMIVLGTASAVGGLDNNGVISFYADASLAEGTYRPISEYAGRTMTWSGSGSYKAFGGIWNSTARTFTVASPTALFAGGVDTVTTGERLLFTDLATGRRVGASFGTVTGSVSFSAAPMGVADLAGLAGVLEEGRGVLSAWNFTTNFSGSEAMLSFDVGPEAEGLSIWHLDDGVWSAYTPSLLTYDANGIASFTVSSFSGYALTAAVPEPGIMGVLALGGAMLLAWRRR